MSVYTLDHLPDGITIKMLDEYARRKESATRHKWRVNNPEKITRQRINSYRNFLRKNGYSTVSQDAVFLFDTENIPMEIKTQLPNFPDFNVTLTRLSLLTRALGGGEES